MKIMNMNYEFMKERIEAKNTSTISCIGCAVLLLLFTWSSSFLHAQITVTGNQTATILAQKLTGTGVTVSNATLNCAQIANGTFVVTPPNVTNLGLDSGIVLTSGAAETNGFQQGCNGPASGPSNANNTPGDPDLAILCNQSTFDACVLEFDFVPLGDTVKFQYVFGSSEYPSFTCTAFNDVFGFFISGPGITGPYSNNSKNIALVPGSTTCPVGVSTIYCPNSAGCCNTTTFCFGQTPGCSAYNATNNTCAYFVCNAGGASVNYQGFTTVLTAQSVVTPCSTHHLKLAISDAADQVLDSGVFLKEGSLSSNSISLTPISVLNNPDPYIVEGCAVGYVKVSRPVATSSPYTVFYSLGGTTSASDYTVSTVPLPAPPGQVIIPANDTVAYVVFYAVPDATPEPMETITLYYLAPCSTTISDSTTLFVSDSFQMHILTPDTAICAEDSLHILVFGSDSLNYTWTPTSNINNPTIKEPMVSPNSTTSYVVCASLPLSGCQPKCDTIQVIINQPPQVNIGHDTILCKNMAVPLSPSITPVQTYTYNWTGSGVGFLNQTNIVNPTATFTAEGNYQLILNVDPVAQGCQGSDTMNILVLPNDIFLHNGDTTICEGAQVMINVTGHPLFTYDWNPPQYLNNPTLEDPISTPPTDISYTVTATYPGCTPMSKSFDITVEPNPMVNVGPDRVMCDHDTIQLYADVFPPNFNGYIYNWSPTIGLSNSTIQDPVFQGGVVDQLYQVIVSTPIGCSDTDSIFVHVYSTEFATVTPDHAIICAGDTVFYNAIGGVSYLWRDRYFLSDTTIMNPYATPNADIDYTIFSTSAEGCTDTDKVHIMVASNGVLDAGEDQNLYPGESTQLYADGNCSSFQWFPPNGLSSSTIKNPIAQPSVTTQYIVYGTTEFGCKAEDTVTIRISPESILDLPNAFSPGSGTSLNDGLNIKVRGQVTLRKFEIFNRWGNQVFSTTDIRQGWDGKYNGKPQPMGAYVYVIDAVTSNGQAIHKQGNVTLIR